MVELLIHAGVKVSIQAFNGKRALDIAKAHKNAAVIPLLKI
jgi:ankyrin repeat protein